MYHSHLYCAIIKYITFYELRQHCDALYKFGDNHVIMEKIAKSA
jgi:type II restriction enzyme